MQRLPLALLLLAACSPRPPTEAKPTVRESDEPTAETPLAANPKAQPSGSLGEQLMREVGAGRSVAIVAGADGLRAFASDGARQRVLVPLDVPWSVIDQRSNVIWFGSPDLTEFRAIDLDAPASDPPARITVVVGLPQARVDYYGVNYVDPKATPSGMAWAMGTQFATSTLGDMNQSSISLGIMTPATESMMVYATGYFDDLGDLEEGESDDDSDDESDDESDEEPVIGKVVGSAFLTDLLARPDHRAPEPERPASRVEGVDTSKCDEPSRCGEAQAIPGTRYLRVMTANYAGDITHINWQLYDLERKQFLTESWASMFDNAFLAPDHTAFVTGGVLVGFEGGPVKATPSDRAGAGGGWIGGGAIYD